MDAKEGEEVDHINGNTLVNIESNLRICTHTENTRNNHKSTIKGVMCRNGRWRAWIRYNKKLLHLGTYSTQKEAGVAYNNAAKLLYGEFANLNKLD
jgi:hypothetical protein